MLKVVPDPPFETDSPPSIESLLLQTSEYLVCALTVAKQTVLLNPGGTIADRLFKVTPGHDADYALEQATVLLDCIYKMTLEAGVEGGGRFVWETHYLSGMAKALVEDVAHGMTKGRRVQ